MTTLTRDEIPVTVLNHPIVMAAIVAGTNAAHRVRSDDDEALFTLGETKYISHIAALVAFALATGQDPYDVVVEAYDDKED